VCVYACLWFCVRTFKVLLKYLHFLCFFLKLLSDLKCSCSNRADAPEISERYGYFIKCLKKRYKIPPPHLARTSIFNCNSEDHQHGICVRSTFLPLDGLKEKSGYWKLQEEALDRTLWITRIGRGYGFVVK
jgi:hypothetical protein